MVWQDFRARGGPATEWATPGNLVDWQAERSIFESIASIRGWRPTLTGMGDPEPVPGEQVTEDYFKALGVMPAHGRLFQPQEMVPNAPRVVILSHDTWMRRFGGDPQAIGRSMMLSGEPHEIVGVLPDGVRPIVNADAELWRPDRLNLANPPRGAIVLRVVARLKPGVSIDQSRAAMDALAKQLEIRFPETNTKTGFNIVPLHEQVVGAVRPGVLVLFAAVVFVMLITCVNIANLLLARAPERTREMAVRTALGARRWRVVGQLLTESVLLATIGGVAGIVLSAWGVQALIAIAPEGTPRLDEVGLNVPVLMFAALLSVITGVLFGLTPALQLARRGSSSGLKESARGAAGGAGHRTRRALIVAEIAVALVLVIAGGLLLRTLLSLQRTDLGFDPDGVLAGAVGIPAAKYNTPEARLAFQDRLLERVSALPGVKIAALSSIIPLNGGDSDRNFIIEGMAPPRTDDEAPTTWYRLVSAEYFSAMGLRITRGRAFAAREAEPLVVVNETLANRFWPGQDPIGRRVKYDESPEAPWFTIAGVVADVKQGGARSDPRMQTFIPYWHLPREAGFTNVVLKTAGDPSVLATTLRLAVRELDADVPVSGATPMTALVAGSIAEPRFLAQIVGVFATLAALLAAIGVYGVLAYSVRQRTPEIGVRLALGAGRPAILRMVVGDGLRLAAIGLIAGGLVAWYVTPFLGDVLFNVKPADPITFVSTVALILVATLIATLIPARRATRIDPAVALRAE
jgi:putative ABC transport system permease protein